MRESEIEGYLVRRIKALGGEIRKVKWVGRRGAPDRRVMLKGCCMWIELKAPGEKVKPHQAREHERMRANGECVVVLDSIESVNEWFGHPSAAGGLG